MLIVNYWLARSSDGLVTSGKTVLPAEQMIIENGCHVIGTEVLLSSSQGNSCHYLLSKYWLISWPVFKELLYYFDLLLYVR